MQADLAHIRGEDNSPRLTPEDSEPMATKNADCCTCETPTRRRCKDCKTPVCTDCATHGQCEGCVDGRTFAFTDYGFEPSHSFRYHGSLPDGRQYDVA